MAAGIDDPERSPTARFYDLGVGCAQPHIGKIFRDIDTAGRLVYVRCALCVVQTDDLNA